MKFCQKLVSLVSFRLLDQDANDCLKSVPALHLKKIKFSWYYNSRLNKTPTEVCFT
jgi:hypothetical protein